MSLLLALTLAHAQPLVAIVLVDEEARESGYALEVDGFVVGDALPVDVAAGETLSLLEPDGDVEPLHVAPGEVWEVVGADGRALMSELDRDIRRDVLLVRGEPEAIEALAAALGAEIVREGERTWLAGEGVLVNTAWVRERGELRIDAITPVRVEDELPARRAAPRGATPIAELGRAPAEATATRDLRPAPAAAPAPAPVAEPDPVAEPPEPTAAAVEAAVLAESSLDFGTAEEELQRYAGLHLCADDMLWLHPAGIYSLRGVTGRWWVGAPGVVRMSTESGEVLFRAAIDPETGFCRDVWTPDETGDEMPEGYERFESKRKRRR